GMESGASSQAMEIQAGNRRLQEVNITLNRLVEDRTRALQEQHEYLASVLMAVPVPLAVLRGPEFRYYLQNDAHKALVNGRDVIGMTHKEALPHVTRQLQPLLQQVYQTGQPFCTHRYRLDGGLGQTPEQGEYFFDFFWHPLFGADGKVEGVIAVSQDVTARVRDENALRAALDKLRWREQTLTDQARLLREQASLLEITHDAILARGMDDIITYWNRGAEKLYGYTKEEAIGQDCHALLKTQAPLPIPAIKQIVNREHHWEGELVHEAKDGRKINVASQWTLDPYESPPRYLQTNTDITRRVQMERAVRQTQENYRLLVETSTEFAMIITDPEGNITSWNAGAEKILGLSYDEAVGKPISAIFTPEDRDTGQPWRELELARNTGRAEDVRWHIRKDGARFWANGVVMPLWDDDGKLRGFTKIMRDQTTHRLAEERMQFLANHDALTGLANRVNFSNQLHKSLALADRTQLPVALLMLDLDRFKQVNDTFGHHAGDLLLKEVARRLQSSLRETDFVARLGGDEFVIIQAEEAAQPHGAAALAAKLIAELGRPYQLDQQEIKTGTSIGIALYPQDAKDSIELAKRADLALYRAKSQGRGNHHFYTVDLLAEKEWEKHRGQKLGAALANHEFKLYYQPQVDLQSWKVSSVEALLRWQVSDQDMILPDDFLGIAEETGVIVEIGKWALRNACEQARHWLEQGLPKMRISINCSARQFSGTAFVKTVAPILEDTGLSPSCLELEIPESMLARPEVKDQLAALRHLGVRITIDNYGTGTTALADLKQFEIDGLKIDKSFVKHVPHRYKDSALTASIIDLGRNLGIDVSAGGVETPEQLAYLKSKHCKKVQGFIFSPPIPAEEFQELMLSGRLSRINPIPPDGETNGKELH
ncbi:MAG: sensor domain-containing protein, partial [Noviherbaspirillum sp.]